MIEAKKLTGSDLTFFSWHFHHPSAWPSTKTKQKAVNPSKDVVKKVFPALAIPGGPGNFLLRATLYGPGLAGPDLHHGLNFTLGPKNWRLNGLHPNPSSMPTRYDGLTPGDWVIIAMSGTRAPTALDLVFLDGKHAGDDRRLISALVSRGAGSRTLLSTADLVAVINAAAPAPTHGVHQLLPTTAASLAATGAPAAPAAKRVVQGTLYRGRMSPKAFAAGRRLQLKAGAHGEVLVDRYLTQQVAASNLNAYDWASRKHPDEPFDFELDRGSPEWVDVKSTVGGFDTDFYVSANELLAMVEPTPYRIYRVFDVNSARPRLRISCDVTAPANKAIAAITGFPAGMDVPQVTWRPSQLAGVTWSNPVDL